MRDEAVRGARSGLAGVVPLREKFKGVILAPRPEPGLVSSPGAVMAELAPAGAAEIGVMKRKRWR